eukprot:CAMPEP_0170365480 /NCGR_PEP_ID=MMETSP0117_2-20130122/5922_1 /TAXON_ID=400756 /ORGANISM="Durinskia baltica, Strain CSIRO CS-38" /LENGTH=253 /DNA_ID=CAMNT_0010620035 /DNA_START=129 /DNA_END=887 /DNA_ORIENTATION=+
MSAEADAKKWSDTAKYYAVLAEKMPIVSHFNAIASELLFKDSGASLVAGSTFVDVCAGPATFTLASMKLMTPEQRTSINFLVSDFSQGMIDEAKKAVDVYLPGNTNVNFQVIDVQDIALPDESADVVGHMFGYFVPDRKKAFTEVFRITKTGGTVVIGVWKYAAMAPLLNDFLVYMNKTPKPNAMDIAHSCADGVAFRNELLGYGYSQVTVHESERVFALDIRERELLMGLFSNPMISAELAGLTPEFLFAEW